MNFDEVTSLQIDNQEIIELFINNVLVWQKNQKTYGELFATFSGNNVTLNNAYVTDTYPSAIFDDGTYIAEVNWGDNHEEVFDGSVYQISHSYEDGLNNHTIKFTKDFEQLNGIFYNCSNLIDIIIPLSVTSLGNGCFGGCSGLSEIDIPSSVTSLGNGCFAGCSGLSEIDIPSSVTSLGNGCFAGCINLTKITFPSNIKTLKYTCLAGCTSLTEVVLPHNVMRLESMCFNNCTSLSEITIPSTVNSIENGCFYNCTNLTKYNLNWDSSNTIIAYDTNIFQINTNTVFNIPYGTTDLYIAKNYPSDKLVEQYLYYNEDEVTCVRGSNAHGDNLVSELTDIGTSDWTLSFDLKTNKIGGCLNIGASNQHNSSTDTANYRLGIGFDIINNQLKNYANNRTTSSYATSNQILSTDTYYKFKMVKSGRTVTFYQDDVLFATKTVSWLPNYSSYDLYPLIWNKSGNSITFKNVKLEKN